MERKELHAEEGEKTPMMKGKDLEESQVRIEKRKGDEGPPPQPAGDDYDFKNDEQVYQLSGVMANTLGQRTRVPAEPPAMFWNEKHQDICMWLLTCIDY